MNALKLFLHGYQLLLFRKIPTLIQASCFEQLIVYHDSSELHPHQFQCLHHHLHCYVCQNMVTIEAKVERLQKC